MTLGLSLVEHATSGDPATAWKALTDHALAICSAPLSKDTATRSVTQRDRDIGKLDHFLSTSGWDLWKEFPTSVESNAGALRKWWAEPYAAKAVLILDGLSLREFPWLLQGAEAHGFTVHRKEVFGAELPAETNEFASALGLSSRSQLQNNGGGPVHALTPSSTESVALPWLDCAKLIDSSTNWVFWHQWPDNKLHDGSGAGQGLDQLTRDVAEQLTSDDFWGFVGALAQGRRVVITSDHGYAATGLFFDATDEQAQYLKDTFRSGRSRPGKKLEDFDVCPFVPPNALAIQTTHGAHLLALGRWKWRSPGGYPTLAHGGLSLLEVLCPFVELTKQG
ncbi:MAG: hypothetical protein AB7S74_15945 [Hyphomicrobium sp.]